MAVPGSRGTPGSFRARCVWGDERGDTLAELIVAIAIMATAIVVIVGAMANSISLSDRNRKQANAQTVITQAAEAVKDQTRNPYVACNPTYSAVSGVQLPSGWTSTNVKITGVKYWDGTSQFIATCPSSDNKLQTITLLVTAPSGKASSTVDVVKRNPN